MKKIYFTILSLALFCISANAQTVIPTGDEYVVPQYAYYGPTYANRVQVAVYVKLSGLTPNTGYRYCSGISSSATTPQNTTPADTFVPGQFFTIRNTPANSTYGNIDGMAAAKGLNGNIIQSNTVNLTFSGPIYAGGFTSLSDGTYTGWFAATTVNNSTQEAAGSDAYFYIQLGVGTTSYLPTLSYRTTSTIKLLDYNTTSGSTSGITALVGTSNVPAEKFVTVYDNSSFSGRPLYSSWTEDDGLSNTGAFGTGWYSTNITAAGSWGAVIPNALTSGVQGIKYLNIDGTEYGHATSTNGSWGSVSTVNPAGGTTTPIVIDATPTTILPIKLVDFSSDVQESGVKLNWETAQEINNQYFDLLRSVDGKNFTSIAKVDGAGNSSENKYYSYLDYNPQKGTNYYQLKQVDNDGKSTLSKVIAAKFGLAEDGIKVSSVSDHDITLAITLSKAQVGTISYTSLDGKILYQKELSLAEGINNVSIPTDQSFGKIGILSFSSANGRQSIKISR